MKKIIIGFLFLPLLIAASFPNAKQISKAPYNSAVYKLMEVTYLWELLSTGYQPSRKRDATWLDVGFRAKYAMARNYASLDKLEDVFNTPIFISGPHGKNMNFNSKTSFGHYNPAFITKLTESVQTVLRNPVFHMPAKQAYHQYFEPMALTYKNSYIRIQSNPKRLNQLKINYLKKIIKAGGTHNTCLNELLIEQAKSNVYSKPLKLKDRIVENPRADVYEESTAPSFWVRRSLDGTDKQLYKLLNLIITELEYDGGC